MNVDLLQNLEESGLLNPEESQAYLTYGLLTAVDSWRGVEGANNADIRQSIVSHPQLAQIPSCASARRAIQAGGRSEAG